MTTLKAGRRRLGGRLGFFLVSTTTSTASAATDFVCADLIDSDAEPSKFKNCWAMPVSTTSAAAGEVRRIKATGFTPTTGKVSTVASYSTTLSSGVEVEIYGVLPPKATDGRDGLLECINLALQESWTIDTLPITGSTGCTYSLSVYPWITDEDWIVDVWVRRSGSTTDDLVREWRFQHDADAPSLELREYLSTTDTLKPRIYRPMDTWIKTGATWAASTTGLVNDSDECLLSLEGIEVIGLARAYETLAQTGDLTGKQLDQAKANSARVRANAWKAANLSREFGRRVHWNRAQRQTGAWPREGSLGP